MLQSLTKKQEAQIKVYRERWLDIGLSTQKADRAKAEAGVKLAYEAAKLTPPKYIIWLDSPYQGAIGAAFLKNFKNVRAQVRAQVWAQVGDQVWDQVWAQVGAQVRAQVWDQVWAQVGAQVRAQVWDQVRDQVRDQVWAQVWDQVRAQVRDQVGAQVGDQVGDQVGAQVRAQVWDQVNTSAFGQHDAGWLSWLAFWDEVCGLECAARTRGLRMVAENAGWWWPFENFCILTERPTKINRDSANRLHCEDGKAIEYPDGWGVHVWHGVRIPSWIIENPEQISGEKIEAENNAEIRRIMITKYGMARYLEESGAKEIDRDRDTKGERILYAKKDKLGLIKMIKLENSTPERDGSIKNYTFRVAPDIKTCREAVAYLYSMDASLYSPRVES